MLRCSVVLWFLVDCFCYSLRFLLRSFEHISFTLLLPKYNTANALLNIFSAIICVGSVFGFVSCSFDHSQRVWSSHSMNWNWYWRDAVCVTHTTNNKMLHVFHQHPHNTQHRSSSGLLQEHVISGVDENPYSIWIVRSFFDLTTIDCTFVPICYGCCSNSKTIRWVCVLLSFKIRSTPKHWTLSMEHWSVFMERNCKN